MGFAPPGERYAKSRPGAAPALFETVRLIDANGVYQFPCGARRANQHVRAGLFTDHHRLDFRRSSAPQRRFQTGRKVNFTMSKAGKE